MNIVILSVHKSTNSTPLTHIKRIRTRTRHQKYIDTTRLPSLPDASAFNALTGTEISKKKKKIEKLRGHFFFLKSAT